ncbi:MAG: tRNA uridine-5-carboxymethylaminomethyl(34) synthesis GTPase MnmE [Clostridia bacterium]|nr:tRNA uridine-5-carboxymethylaminomethyl(34) synthesis GTPase MnmE [Clostridia bacterium]
MHNLTDTICAQATPPGEGGIAILRMSGPRASGILKEVFRPASGSLIPRMLTYGKVVDGDDTADEAMAVLLPGPRSYTRQDVAEIHCHGSQALTSRILRLLMARGARPAEPGEFTYRAFALGRIDLSQAEAVMRMIRADSDRAMKSAVRQIEGGVSSFIKDAREEIIGMLSALSAAIDFPDEVEEQETREALLKKCALLKERLSSSTDPREGRLEDEGLRVALCGQPNAGKSSLLNALLGEDRAIVTAIPGTTRDVIEARTQMDGYSVILTDTAGLRDAGDEVERIGIERAQKALSEADVRLMVIDGSEPLEEESLKLAEEISPHLVVISKEDLPQAFATSALEKALPGVPVLSVSAPSGEGLAELKTKIASLAKPEAGEGAILTQARHAEAALRACASIGDAIAALNDGFETDVAAVDLSAALDALGEITGETLSEQVIDEVFARFCVGK